ASERGTGRSGGAGRSRTPSSTACAAAAPPGQTAITAWDLFDYAHRQTEAWTAANRPARQSPILLPPPESGGRDRAAAITLAIKAGALQPAEAPGATFQAPEGLAVHWTECRRLEGAV